jgi:O-acetylserine/cysteine efflux transporter
VPSGGHLPITVLFVTLASTLVAFGICNHLLSCHPAHMVAPYSLLLPVVGFVTSWLVLDEPPARAEVTGGVAVLAGLVTVTVRRAGAALPSPKSVPAEERITT